MQQDPRIYFEIFRRADDALYLAELHADETLVRIVDANESACRMFGRSRSELLTMTPYRLMLEESRDRFRQALERLPSEGAGRVESKLTAGHGAPPAAEQYLKLLPLRGGSYVLAAVRDMEEPVGNTRPSKETRRISESIFQNNLDAVFSLDLRGRIVDINLAGERMTGYSRKELLGKSYAALAAPGEPARVDELYRNAAAHGLSERLKVGIVRKDGTPVELEVTSIPLIQGKRIRGTIGIAKDVTKQTRTLQFLDGQHRIMEMIAGTRPLRSILDAVLRLIQRLSGGFCSLLLLDQAKEKLHVTAASDLAGENGGRIDETKFDPIALPRGAAALRQETVFIPDLMHDARWQEYRPVAEMFSLRTCCLHSILHEGEWLGTFILGYREVREPSESDLQFVGRAGNLIRIAVQHHRTDEIIRHMAYHDRLTGLPNRRMLEARLEAAITRKGKHALMFLDLDRFKIVNDSSGHRIGDLLLQQVSLRLTSCIRERDTVCRQGGDEFVLLVEDASEADAASIAQRILDAVSEPFFIEDHELYVTPSIGISHFPRHGTTAQLLMRNADFAMYHAKQKGKNNFQVYHPDLNIRSEVQMETILQLRKALENNEFLLYYQPQYDLRTGAVKGIESFIRWNHPLRGIMSPGEFISLAEETGLILPIGKWVLREACLQGRRWLDQGLAPRIISVNLSARQFNQPDLIADIARILQETGYPAEYLELEITEDMTMDMAFSSQIIEGLRALGVLLAIDDFGTGYSSLHYLKRLPIYRLKIDRSFVGELLTSRSDRDIVSAIITMSHSLGIRVIAEGVEQPEQLAFLKEQGCDEAQGYLFCKPVSPQRLEDQLRQP